MLYYKLCEFLEQNALYLGLSKIENSHDKMRFRAIFITVQYRFVFLLSPRYNKFYSKNLHTGRLKNCLHQVFFGFFKCLNSIFQRFK
jgi:hypothetical protein